MNFNFNPNPLDRPGKQGGAVAPTQRQSDPPAVIRRYRRDSVMKRSISLAALLVAAAVVVGGAAQTLAPRAQAAPAPEVEYLYDVTVRRHYDFPSDALNYGYRICDKVDLGDSYAKVIDDVKNDVAPSDEYAANYLVSYAVNLLCPAQIWQLRHSAAHYRPPADR